jgi:hypothetical protein
MPGKKIRLNDEIKRATELFEAFLNEAQKECELRNITAAMFAWFSMAARQSGATHEQYKQDITDGCDHYKFLWDREWGDE